MDSTFQTLLAILGVLYCLSIRAYAQIDLGTAAPFGIVAASAISNTGATVVKGELGLYPDTLTSITGFPPGLSGTVHAADGVANQAHQDVQTAYNAAAAMAQTTDLTGEDLGGKTLVAGTYHFSSSVGITGALTLDGKNDPNAQFVFQIGSTLTTATASSVVLINGAEACNIFWQVGSSATLGTATIFVGNILASASIAVNDAVTVAGGLYALTGAVTLINDQISPQQNCAAQVGDTSSATSTLAQTVATELTSTSLPSSLPSTVTEPSPGTPTSGSGNAGSGNAGSGNTGAGNAGAGNAGAGNAGTGNAGTGNAGTGNAGAGNAGAGNAGTGNAGTGNAGTGNAGTGNAGTGNAGTGNAGAGNAGTGNAGAGNAGAGNAGAGNVGTGNAGAGNAGTGNAGAGNAGAGNAGTGNAGAGNVGTGNAGAGNAGTGNSETLLTTLPILVQSTGSFTTHSFITSPSSTSNVTSASASMTSRFSVGTAATSTSTTQASTTSYYRQTSPYKTSTGSRFTSSFINTYQNTSSPDLADSLEESYPDSAHPSLRLKAITYTSIISIPCTTSTFYDSSCSCTKTSIFPVGSLPTPASEAVTIVSGIPCTTSTYFDNSCSCTKTTLVPIAATTAPQMGAVPNAEVITVSGVPCTTSTYYERACSCIWTATVPIGVATASAVGGYKNVTATAVASMPTAQALVSCMAGCMAPFMPTSTETVSCSATPRYRM